MLNTDRPAIALRLSALLLACLMLLCACGPTLAQDLTLPQDPLQEPDRWLSDSRWSELRYGLSIREPHEPTRVADTAQGDVIRWALPQGVRIRLAFARGFYEGFDGRGQYLMMPAKVDVLKKQISDELRAAFAGQVINTRADQVVEVGDIIGIINYFIVKPDKRVGEPHLHGFAILQLDQTSVAVLRLECPPDQVANAVSTFECMVNSIKVEPAKDVNRRIHNWLTNSEELLANITQEDRLNAMRKDQLFRVLDAGNDLGFVRIWQRYQGDAYYDQAKKNNTDANGRARLQGLDKLEVTGNALVVQSRFEARGGAIERLYEAIDEDDDINEYWQFKTTMRYKNDPNNRRAGTWAETGVRGIATIGGDPTDHVSLTQEGSPPRHMVQFLLERERDPARKLRWPSADPRSYPSGDLKEKAWKTPKRAFLSIVDAQLIPALLPREEKTYAFTAYHPDSTRIDIRTMRVQPNPDGGKTVYIRPILDMAEQKLVYDKNNTLISHTFPDGREMKRTTREELARIWGVKLKD